MKPFILPTERVVAKREGQGFSFKPPVDRVGAQTGQAEAYHPSGTEGAQKSFHSSY